MIWVAWRQHRAQIVAAGVFLLLLAAALVPVRLQMSHYLNQLQLPACVAAHHDCSDLMTLFTNKFSSTTNMFAWLNFVPLLIGLFWGAPLVARELEQGTHRLAWTQGVTRRRWLLTKLLILIVGASLFALAFSALSSWWFKPVNIIQGYSRMQTNVFDFNGIVPLGYTLFALAAGTAAGVFIRRTLPAMVAALAAYLPLRLLLQHFRGHLVHPLQAVNPWMGSKSLSPHQDDWIVQISQSNAQGQPIDFNTIVSTCHPAAANKDYLAQCATAHGFRQSIFYQPASRFWELQLIETAIFIGLAAILFSIAVLWTIKRLR